MALTAAKSLDAFAAYNTWATNAGIICPSVRVASLPPPYGRGLVAVAAIKANTRIISVPQALTLCMGDYVRNTSHPLKPLIETLKSRMTVVEDDLCALMLLYEARVRGSASPYAAHIAQLPAVVDMPYMFDEADVPPFKGTNVFVLASTMMRQVRADYDVIATVLRENAAAPGGDAPRFPLTEKEVTYDSYRWALAIVASRMVSLRYHARDNKSSVYKTLVPFFDMANHSGDANVRHYFDHVSKCVVVQTLEDIQPGEQVFLNYGDAPATTMVRLHGFVNPGVPMQEMYTLQLSLPEAMPFFKERVAMIHKYAGFVSSTPAEIATAARTALRMHNATATTAPAAATAAPDGSSAAASAEEAEEAAKPPVMCVSTTSDPRCMQGVVYPPPSGGVAIEFGMSEGAAHLALLRVMRIVTAESAEQLVALEETLVKHPDRNALGVEHEVGVQQSIASTFVDLLKKFETVEGETEYLARFKTMQEEGHAAMTALSASIRAELVVRGWLTPADAAAAEAALVQRAAAAAASDAAEEKASAEDGEDAGFAVSVLAAGKRKPASGGKKGAGSKKGKGKAASSSAASAAAPIVTAPVPVPFVPPPSTVEYRRMLAAYVRDVERRVISFHLRSTMRDIAELKTIVEHIMGPAAEGAAAADGAAAEAAPSAAAAGASE